MDLIIEGISRIPNNSSLVNELQGLLSISSWEIYKKSNTVTVYKTEWVPQPNELSELKSFLSKQGYTESYNDKKKCSVYSSKDGNTIVRVITFDDEGIVLISVTITKEDTLDQEETSTEAIITKLDSCDNIKQVRDYIETLPNYSITSSEYQRTREDPVETTIYVYQGLPKDNKSIWQKTFEESLTLRESKVELKYDDLLDSNDNYISYTYSVSPDKVYYVLMDYLPEEVTYELFLEKIDDYVEENCDILLDYFRNDAQEDAYNNYEPEIDWDMMPGGHDDY